MSIEIRDLTKVYGEQTAVNSISFQISEGEIVGFLGPNGAGKSTTMKILAGYIPQTSGTAEVCGHNISESPLVVKRSIGYLPEHNPLYLEMYVVEFLDFIARTTGVDDRKNRIEEVIALTGLAVERKKKIGQLSKGYRQRVGLAQALLHKPKVLILDEPTSGLDPNQVQEIRKLILSLGKDRTVMLSTHIMQEVEAMCSRVIIINKGNIVADDDTASLSKRIYSGNSMLVQFKKDIDQAQLLANENITKVDRLDLGKYRVQATDDVDLAEFLFNIAVDNETIILEQRQDKKDLEEVFQQLTKNA